MADWCVVGLAGATCSGKTTVARRLHEAHPGSALLSQDDFFLPKDDPRHTAVPGLGHSNWDTLTAIDGERLVAAVEATLARPPPPTAARPALLILEGFLVLNDARLRALCDVRVFLTLGRAECWARRRLRVYEPPDVPGYFEACVWPEYERHLAELRAADATVTFLDGERPVDWVYQLVAEEVARARRRLGAS